MKHFLQQIFGAIILVIFLGVTFVHADDLTSAHFIVRDPLVGTGGGYGSSASFGSFLSGDMTMIGEATSTSFGTHYGFLYYPYVIQGIFSASAVGSSANLSWGASTAGLGWNVSGYNTGKATVSGGPYTYTAVGNVTSYSYTGLTPGNYCFVLQTLDAFNNVIATSSEQCVTISPTITFDNNQTTIDFGTLSSSSVKYATGGAASGGLGTDTIAHTMTITSNAPNGYSLTYLGPTLTSGTNTITVGTNIGTGGTPGSKQFAMSGVLTGTGSMASGYNHATPNWSFVNNSTTQVASAGGVVSSDSVAMHYEANITTGTAAGQYSTAITYILTGNF